MDYKQAIKVLREYNRWRRGAGRYAAVGVKCPHTAFETGLAIDVAIEGLMELNKIKNHDKQNQRRGTKTRRLDHKETV